MDQTNLRKAHTNTEYYVKTRMGENHGERFHYNNGDYIGVL